MGRTTSTTSAKVTTWPGPSRRNGFEDLTARINDPAWAEEKAKYLYWDRIEAYGPKLMGLPIVWHVEDALFANMDMVREAGFDETFVEDWDTFVECVTAMTKGTETYGLGIGMQLGGFGEWYQRARAAGGRYLTEDLSAPAINTPDVVLATQQLVDFFAQGIAPPQGTFDYNTAPDAFIAGRLAIYSSDLTIAAVLGLKPEPPAFEWAVLPYPPGPQTRVNFNDVGLYAMSSKTPNKDLAWEVLKFWTSGEQAAFWTGRSGTYPARVDAEEMGYDEYAAPQLAASFEQFQEFSVGPEPFAQWGTIEDPWPRSRRPAPTAARSRPRKRSRPSSRSCSRRCLASPHWSADLMGHEPPRTCRRPRRGASAWRCAVRAPLDMTVDCRGSGR